MRPVVKSERWDIGTKQPLEISPYGDAKPDLIDEIGNFCSFCEKRNSRSALHVEHIKAKDLPKYANDIYRWDNFLLCCVNCNSVKGKKDVAVIKPYMPHEDNLLCFIEIKYGGAIGIKSEIIGTEYDRTKSFIDLIGLDRNPSHPKFSAKDDRWEERMSAYDIAKSQLVKYVANSHTFDIENMIIIAIRSGFFSIWFTVFQDHKEVRKALIEAFVGTHRASFDADFNPIPRNTNDL